MKSKLFRSVLLCVMAFALAFGVVACGDKPVTPGPDQTGNAVARYATDTRAKAFGVYTADGDVQEEFNDMYKAIAYCVENGDEGDYVAKLDGSDKDVKLFIQKEVYSGQSSDQFWYYENGTSLDRYTPWQNDYHTDLGSVSKHDLVVMNTANGLETYRHGFEVVSIGGTGAAQGGVLATWNVYPFYDANIQVDIYKHMGITKADYTIKLTESKIYPTYEGYQKTYAHIGFINPDSNNVAQYGLACDVNTGNWYYYYGNADTGLSHDAEDETAGIIYDTSKVVLTSTWNEAGGYYTPDKDVKLTGEIVTLDDNGSPYYVDRLTADFGDNNVFTKDFEQAAMTACATMRFTAGINIWNDSGMPMYDNGAKFENLKITSAIGTVYEEIANDPEKYGGNPSGLDAGEYDLLNSNPASAARFHTVLYNRAVIDYDFDTAGQDIYSFSFRMSENQPAYSSTIRNVKDLIAALPAAEDIVEADEDAKVVPARNAYNALVKPYQSDYITAAELAKLVAAEDACLQFHFSQEVTEVLSLCNSIKTIGKDGNSYTSLANLKEDKDTITAAKTKFDALTEDEQKVVTDKIGTKLADAATAVTKLNALAEDFDSTNVDTALAAAAVELWPNYVDSETFAGVCDLDAADKIYRIRDVAKYASLTADEKAAFEILDGGKTKWAVDHINEQYGKYDQLVAKIPALKDATGRDLEVALYEIVGIFNSLDNSFSYGFRVRIAMGDGKYWAYAKTVDLYKDLETAMAGKYEREEGGFKLVPVDGYSFNPDASEEAGALITAINELKNLGGVTNSYTSIEMFTADAEKINTAWTKYQALSTAEKAEVTNGAKLVAAHNALVAIDALAEDYDFTKINAVLAAAAENIWNVYVNATTFTNATGASAAPDAATGHIADIAATAKIKAIKDAGWADLDDAAKNIVLLMEGGVSKIAWAIEHVDGEYAKIESFIEKVTALGTTGDTIDATALDEIIELFNSMDICTAYALHNSGSEPVKTALKAANGTYFTDEFFTQAGTLWTKLSAANTKDGRYIRASGHYKPYFTLKGEHNGHSPVAVEGADGKTYYYCAGCDRYYSDEACTQRVNPAPELKQ